MTEEKKQTDYKKLVGRIGNQYYFLDYSFEHGPDFKGVTGSIMEPMTEEEYTERVTNYFSEENMAEFWKQAVEAEKTTMGLSEWIDFVKDIDGEEGVIDRSYSNSYGAELQILLGLEKAHEVECTGGGRCFSKNMIFDEVYAPELVEIINQFEQEESKK